MKTLLPIIVRLYQVKYIYRIITLFIFRQLYVVHWLLQSAVQYSTEPGVFSAIYLPTAPSGYKQGKKNKINDIAVIIQMVVTNFTKWSSLICRNPFCERQSSVVCLDSSDANSGSSHDFSMREISLAYVCKHNLDFISSDYYIICHYHFCYIA